jgi:hypothetical protein
MDVGSQLEYGNAAPCTEPGARVVEAETEPPVLDLDWLRVQLGCDDDTIRSLLELYTSRGAELVAAMAAAITAGDGEALRFHGHALKGISGTIGALRIHALLREDAHTLSSVFPRIEQAFVEVRGLIAQRLAGHG